MRVNLLIIGILLSLLLLPSLCAPSLLSPQKSLDIPRSMTTTQQTPLEFNGSRAFSYLEAQCAFGPRPPGSENLTLCGDYIISVLEGLAWPVTTQTWTFMDVPLRNIMAGAVIAPRYVLLAHYDTRPIADYDPVPENRTKPILGANDGASGVAALLELAAVLPEIAKNSIALLFVDAEDSGNVNNWPWIVGSTHYVNSLTFVQRANIQAAILLDMMGDADLQLKREQSSTQELVDAIWSIAENLNYGDEFLNEPGFLILDDHRPFLDAGIPAIDIIDFDYPYWHTLADTPDKCSPASLEAVGRVVEEFIQIQLFTPTIFPRLFPDPIQVGAMILVIIMLGVLGGVIAIYVLRRRD